MTPITLRSLLDRAYRHFEDRLAVVDGDRRTSYGELGKRAHALARAFRQAGAVPGDRVLIISGNRREFVEIEQAAFLGGFVRVALSPRLHPAEVATIIADCDPSVIAAERGW